MIVMRWLARRWDAARRRAQEAAAAAEACEREAARRRLLDEARRNAGLWPDETGQRPVNGNRREKWDGA